MPTDTRRGKYSRIELETPEPVAQETVRAQPPTPQPTQPPTVDPAEARKLEQRQKVIDKLGDRAEIIKAIGRPEDATDLDAWAYGAVGIAQTQRELSRYGLLGTRHENDESLFGRTAEMSAHADEIIKANQEDIFAAQRALGRPESIETYRGYSVTADNADKATITTEAMDRIAGSDANTYPGMSEAVKARLKVIVADIDNHPEIVAAVGRPEHTQDRNAWAYGALAIDAARTEMLRDSTIETGRETSDNSLFGPQAQVKNFTDPQTQERINRTIDQVHAAQKRLGREQSVEVFTGEYIGVQDRQPELNEVRIEPTISTPTLETQTPSITDNFIVSLEAQY